MSVSKKRSSCKTTRTGDSKQKTNNWKLNMVLFFNLRYWTRMEKRLVWFSIQGDLIF